MMQRIICELFQVFLVVSLKFSIFDGALCDKDIAQHVNYIKVHFCNNHYEILLHVVALDHLLGGTCICCDQ